MNRNTWANWRKWGNFGLTPIPTRQLSSALFALSGHILIALVFMLGLLQTRPERVSPPPVKTMQVQLKPSQVLLPSPTPLPATQWVTSSPQIPPQASSTEAMPDPGAQPKPDPIPQSAASTPASAPAATSASDAANAPAVASPSEEVAYYYPARQLHQKPQVIEDIDTNLTLTLPGIETQNVILRLFINERGGIDHIDIEQSSLAPEVVAAVSGAFGKLRFTPGKIDGLAVKSQLKIEVLLENEQTAKIGRKSVNE